MMPKSSAETTRDNVRKYRNAGLIQAKVWVHPQEAGEIRLYAAKQALTKTILDDLKGAPTTITCKARQVSDQMSCHECGLLWDISDPDPPECLTNNKIELAKIGEILK